MIKDVRVFSRDDMHRIIRSDVDWSLRSPWILISIYSSTTGPLLTSDSDLWALADKGCVDVEAFEFHDITKARYDRLCKLYPRSKKNIKLFSEDQARDILAYIDRHKKDDPGTTLVVHCDAGKSRSGAVGLFACRYLGINDRKFIRYHPWIDPNPYVYKTLCSVAELIKKYPWYW